MPHIKLHKHESIMLASVITSIISSGKNLELSDDIWNY